MSRINPNAVLIDGRQRNAEHPDTFGVPDLDETAALKPGDFVKVGIEFEFAIVLDDGEEANEAWEAAVRRFGPDCGPGERPWVEIVEFLARDSYRGLIANDLFFTRFHGKPPA